MNECVEDVDGEEAEESFNKSDSLSEGSSTTNKYQIPQKLTNYSFLKEPQAAMSMATEGSTASKIPDEHSTNSLMLEDASYQQRIQQTTVKR